MQDGSSFKKYNMMKKLYNLLTFLILSAVVYTSCTPDKYDLEKTDIKSEDLVEGIAYTITHDTENPNIVYLTSLMESNYQSLWSHPQGRSQTQKDTLKIAFPGVYKVLFGVNTRGGVVFAADSAEFVIDEFYSGFVDHILWTNLTGGVGHEKTWRLDYGSYGLAAGPLTYCEPQTTWDEWQAGTASIGWAPAWVGNEWIIEEADKDSRMTFSLIDGAEITTHKVTEGVDEEGTFSLDVDNHTITTTDATILRSNNFIANATNWNQNLAILELTENQLMVGVRRTNDEGDYLYVWNFVSDEYAENYVPDDVPDPEPPYDGDANNDLTTTVTVSKTWNIDMDYPYNWFGLDGSALSEVATYGSDPEGFTFTTWTPPYDQAIFESINLSLTKQGDKDGNYELVTADGTVVGNYTIDDSNNIDFGQPLSVFSGVGGWLSFGTSEAENLTNTLRVIVSEKDALGNIEAIWLGMRSADKDEYLALHLKPSSSGGEENPEVALKNIICGSTWKIDSERSYDKTTSWGAEQGPVIFSDYSTWAYNPLPGQHYAAGEADIDYGSMKFELDGTVSVSQHRRIYTYVDETSGETLVRNGSPEDGDILDTDDIVNLNGTWTLDLDNNKLSMSVGVVHPWTCDYMVLDWGDLTIYRIDGEAMLLQALRDPRSGEDAFQMNYVFVPAQ